MSEAKLTEQTRKYLKELEIKHRPHVYFHKVSDKFTSGLPDWYILIKGRAVHIEDKDTGKLPRKLQSYTIRKLKEAGALTLVTDSFSETVEFINSVLISENII
jgi:hypothetical protein